MAQEGRYLLAIKNVNINTIQVRLVNVYGPTEATVCTSLQIYEPEGPFESTSIGKPIPNTELLVLDENMNEVDDGELYIIGPGVARGYFRDEVLTAAKFIHHNGKFMYKTGDRVAVKSDGDILASNLLFIS